MSALEMLVGHCQLAGMFRPAVFKRDFNIVENHGVQFHHTFVAFQQLATNLGGHNYRYVFVFGNRFDFVVIQITEIKAVIKAEHGHSPLATLHAGWPRLNLLQHALTSECLPALSDTPNLHVGACGCGIR
jgi:hypothetical protein